MRALALTLLLMAGNLSTAGIQFDATHARWQSLLQRHVSWQGDGGASSVDYAGFARDRASLRQYLASLAKVSTSQYQRWPEPQRQAFLINAYNAATVELVLDGWPQIRSIKERGNWLRSPWQRPFVTLLGELRSLDDIEHTLLRGAPGFAEPRIHFAVNCASLGCPALRPEPYVGERLDAQLQDQTIRFLGDRSRNRFDRVGARLQISRIFDWYAQDFAEMGGVPGFLAQNAQLLGLNSAESASLRQGRIAISFLPYDWSLNRRQP